MPLTAKTAVLKTKQCLILEPGQPGLPGGEVGWLCGVSAQACSLSLRTLGDSPNLWASICHKAMLSPAGCIPGFCEGLLRCEMGGEKALKKT